MLAVAIAKGPAAAAEAMAKEVNKKPVRVRAIIAWRVLRGKL